MKESAAEPRHPERSIVEVDDLQIDYSRLGEHTPAVKRVSFEIHRGEVFGIVGESGSGKSTLAYSLMRYLASNAKISGGSIRIDGADLMRMSVAELRAYRGTKAAMVFQNPTSALNPSMKIGKQIGEVFRLHSRMGGREMREAVVSSLEEVRFSNASEIMARYPYQLSGGQQQRVCIAMALASDPDLLILDEPTTGLDLSVQAQVLKLLRQLQREREVSMLYISHDLSTVKHFCSRVGIMRDGVMVEQNSVEKVFSAPEHPYTRALLECIPSDDAHKTTVRLKSISEHVVGDAYFDDDVRDPLPERVFANSEQAILAVDGLHKSFGDTVAANGTDLVLRPGEVLGIIGESGSGKSTLARLIAGLTVPDSGTIVFRGAAVEPDIAKRSLAERQGVQMVFQRPDTTLNPVLSVRATLERSIKQLRGEKRAEELMREVMLDAKYLEFSPRRLSGGMKQRVSIARALAGGARVVICDEATSALDPSIQSAILNQIVDLAAQRNTAIIFISHDLNAVRYVSDRVMVVYRGSVVETGEVREVLDRPRHEYTKQLVNSTVENIDWEGPEEFERVFSTEPV